MGIQMWSTTEAHTLWRVYLTRLEESMMATHQFGADTSSTSCYPSEGGAGL